MFVWKSKKVLFIGAILILCAGIALLLPGCVKKTPAAVEYKATPEQIRQAERLNDTADEMYRLAMDGDMVKARDKLEDIGIKVTEMRFEGMTSVEGIGALSQSITEAKRIFNSVQYSQQEGQTAAAKIRLATDALTHMHQPMWLQYYKGMKETAHQLEQAVTNRNKQTAAERLGQLQARYDMIRPSLLISRTPSDVEKMDSLFTFLHSQLAKPELDMKNIGGGLTQLQLALDELFQRRDRAAFVPVIDRQTPVKWIVSLGTIIVAVLSFAAWRIFQFERNTFGGGRHGRS